MSYHAYAYMFTSGSNIDSIVLLSLREIVIETFCISLSNWLGPLVCFSVTGRINQIVILMLYTREKNLIRFGKKVK